MGFFSIFNGVKASSVLGLTESGKELQEAGTPATQYGLVLMSLAEGNKTPTEISRDTNIDNTKKVIQLCLRGITNKHIMKTSGDR